MAELEKTTLRIVGRLLSHLQNPVLKWLRESTQGSEQGQFQNFGAITKKSVGDFAPMKTSDENRDVVIASRTAMRVFVAPKYRQQELPHSPAAISTSGAQEKNRSRSRIVSHRAVTREEKNQLSEISSRFTVLGAR